MVYQNYRPNRLYDLIRSRDVEYGFHYYVIIIIMVSMVMTHFSMHMSLSIFFGAPIIVKPLIIYYSKKI